MPRSKEAISALKGFLRGELKTDDIPNLMFAKGIKAALEWLTQEDRPCPYPELADDLGDAGGWEDLVLEGAGHKPATTPVYTVGEPQPEYRPNVELWTPDSPIPAEADNPKAVAPGSFEEQVRSKPWLGQIAADLAGIQDGTPLSDRNAVVVGAGLGDEPLLRGGYDG